MSLTLFTQKADQMMLSMLDDINENRKDRYVAHYAFHEQGHIIYMAVNSQKEVLFNALTELGELPTGMSVCWRTWCHIKQDFKL